MSLSSIKYKSKRKNPGSRARSFVLNWRKWVRGCQVNTQLHSKTDVSFDFSLSLRDTLDEGEEKVSKTPFYHRVMQAALLKAGAMHHPSPEKHPYKIKKRPRTLSVHLKQTLGLLSCCRRHRKKRLKSCRYFADEL